MLLVCFSSPSMLQLTSTGYSCSFCTSLLEFSMAVFTKTSNSSFKWLSLSLLYLLCWCSSSCGRSHADSGNEAFPSSLESKVAPFSCDSSSAHDLLWATHSLLAPHPSSLSLVSFFSSLFAADRGPGALKLFSA